MRDSIKPTLKAGRTKVKVQDQGYTYNQSGFTYNQSGWVYGGLYEHDTVPMISRSRTVKPSMRITASHGVTSSLLTEDCDYLVQENGGKITLESNIAFDDIRMNVKAGRTKVQIEDQGYTYNETGFVYNQTGWMYGGLYEHDIIPMITKVRIEKPRIIIGGDFGASIIAPSTNSGYLIGMLGMTYP